MIRLVPDHSSLIQRAELVSFTFDQESVLGHDGESVAVALLREGYLRLRNAPNNGGARGVFCCMGLCQECLVQIDGTNIESCRQVVFEGLRVTSLKQDTT